jgi:hypothetical protein
VFRKGMDPAAPASERLYLSLYRMPTALLPADCGIETDTGEITVLRSTLMKPEHRDFIPEMVERLKKLAR